MIKNKFLLVGLCVLVLIFLFIGYKSSFWKKFVSVIKQVNQSGAVYPAVNNFNPLYYWTHENSMTLTDTSAGSQSSASWNYTNYNDNSTWVQTPDKVGSYIKGTQGIGSSWITSNTAIQTGPFTYEFIMEPGTRFSRATVPLLWSDNGGVYIHYDWPYGDTVPNITFETKVTDGQGNVVTDTMVVNFDGINSRSIDSWQDGQFHYFAFSYSPSSGVKKIFIDDNIPDTQNGFKKIGIPAGTLTIDTLNRNGYDYNMNFDGKIDEIAVYNAVIPDNLAYQHYVDMQAGNHFSNSTILGGTTNPLPMSLPVTTVVDPLNYPPGYNINGGYDSSIGITVSSIDQLKNFPTPRYKSGNTLIKNVNWADIAYMAGLFTPGVTNTDVTTNSLALMKELYLNWNYMLSLEGIGDITNSYIDNYESHYPDALARLANDNPTFPLSGIIFRINANGGVLGCNSSMQPYTYSAIWSQCMPADNYPLGGTAPGVGKRWAPHAPIADYAEDGNSVKANINKLINDALTDRPASKKIDILSENHEEFFMWNPTPSGGQPSSDTVYSDAVKNDPLSILDKNASGLGWKSYWAQRVTDNNNVAYRDIIMSLSGLAQSVFSGYSVDGNPDYRVNYAQYRNSNTFINGKNYPTPDIYPRAPSRWDYWSTAWHGFGWIEANKPTEESFGDHYYAPYVAAGWEREESKNLKAPQWIGMQKALAVSGAEFAFTGFFNHDNVYDTINCNGVYPNNPCRPPISSGYIWQMTSFPYAQALMSRVNSLYKNSTLMTGGRTFIQTDGIQRPGKAFDTYNRNDLIVARKGTGTYAGKYIITGSRQQNNNMMLGEDQKNGIASINLEGQNIKFPIRAQGSTYIYDNTNIASPVFYQLDGWHEHTHPYYWSPNFSIEAENFDSGTTTIIKTEATGLVQRDFSTFTSYINPTSGNTSYKFRPRTAGTPVAKQFQIWVKAKSTSGSSSGSFKIDNGTARTVSITNTNYCWQQVKNGANPAVYTVNPDAIPIVGRDNAGQQVPTMSGFSDHTMTFTASNPNFKFDQFILTENPNYSPIGSLCTGAGTIDNIAPIVTVINPVNNAKIPRGTTVVMSVNATDNVGVNKVEYYRNGQLVCTVMSAPFSCNWTIALLSAKGNVTIYAKAYDVAQNIGTSPTITVKKI